MGTGQITVPVTELANELVNEQRITRKIIN
jgi:hypothetical protein